MLTSSTSPHSDDFISTRQPSNVIVNDIIKRQGRYVPILRIDEPHCVITPLFHLNWLESRQALTRSRLLVKLSLEDYILDNVKVNLNIILEYERSHLHPSTLHEGLMIATTVNLSVYREFEWVTFFSKGAPQESSFQRVFGQHSLNFIFSFLEHLPLKSAVIVKLKF